MLPSVSRRRWLQFVGHAGLGVALTPWAWLSSCLGGGPRRANQRSGFGKARSLLTVPDGYRYRFTISDEIIRPQTGMPDKLLCLRIGRWICRGQCFDFRVLRVRVF